MDDIAQKYKRIIKEQNEQLDESMRDLAYSISDKKTKTTISNPNNIQNQINLILKYYNFATVETDDPDEYLSYISDKYNIEHRGVVLKDKWYQNCYGTYLAQLKNEKIVALLSGLWGYYYIDPDTGKKIKINKKTSENILPDALCIYAPLPNDKISIKEFVNFALSSISKYDIIKIILATLGVTLAGMLTPAVTNIIFSGIIPSNSYHLLPSIAVMLLGAAIAAGCISIIKKLIIEKIKLKSSFTIQAAMMNRVMSMPASFFRKFSAGDISSRISTTEKMVTSAIDAFFSVGLTGIFSFLYLIQIFRFTPQLLIPALIIVLLQILNTALYTKTKFKRNQITMKLETHMSGFMLSLLDGIQKIKLSCEENQMLKTWADKYSKITSAKYNLPKRLLWFSSINTFIAAIGTIALYYIAATQSVSYASFLAFTSSYGMFSVGFLALTKIVDTLAQITPMLQLLKPILETKPETEEDKIMPENIKGEITLEDVNFAYNSKSPLIIKGLNLHIKPGQYIGICGQTGCGKSTLLRLLLGFEKPDSGKIVYDDYLIDNINTRVLRRNFGTVLQNAQLMYGTIFQNICIGSAVLTEAQAWEAAEAASIADDIRDMPMGMNTLIPYGGGGLSGGQKQRLLIARALAGNPKIIFFDEATSALDNIAQAAVSESMDSLNCTRVVIAHRLSTIQNCDRIIMLEKGNIVEDGTYDELISLNGKFADLVEKQRLDN